MKSTRNRVNLFDGQAALQTVACAVYPQHRHLTAKVRIFIDFLRNLFERPPYWDRLDERHRRTL